MSQPVPSAEPAPAAAPAPVTTPKLTQLPGLKVVAVTVGALLVCGGVGAYVSAHRKPDRPVAKAHAKPTRKPTAAAVLPLPSLPAGQAVTKAAAAVPGGQVASLREIAHKGGGTDWQAVVVGTDGLRHQVTLSGADGTTVSNTVTGTVTGRTPSGDPDVTN